MCIRDRRLIVEDDYDSEFRFDGRPVPSLQSLDAHGRVVYVGTFSRSIAPGIRIGYMVLPTALLARYRRVFAGYACTVSRLEQQTLTGFLTGGHFTRGLNRARGQYRRRRDALTQMCIRDSGRSLRRRQSGIRAQTRGESFCAPRLLFAAQHGREPKTCRPALLTAARPQRCCGAVF